MASLTDIRVTDRSVNDVDATHRLYELPLGTPDPMSPALIFRSAVHDLICGRTTIPNRIVLPLKFIYSDWADYYHIDLIGTGIGFIRYRYPSWTQRDFHSAIAAARALLDTTDLQAEGATLAIEISEPVYYELRRYLNEYLDDPRVLICTGKAMPRPFSIEQFASDLQVMNRHTGYKPTLVAHPEVFIEAGRHELIAQTMRFGGSFGIRHFPQFEPWEWYVTLYTPQEDP